MRNKLLFLIVLCCAYLLNAQNTIGTLTNEEGVLNGYTLFTSQTETYLIDNCGQVINQWSSSYPPGNAVYLLENGNLLRAAKTDNPDINFGGRGGRIELFNWEGTLIWEYDYSSSDESQHHDIYPMPNGNVLMLAVTVMDSNEAIMAGRNPANLSQNELYNEQILELEPVGTNSANIVWEWNVKDHLIQDFDNTKANFGIVEDNPQLLDINYIGGSNGNANWMHVNSIQYNIQLDQIVMSSRLLNEFYIIDHSTTTIEASGSTGGLRGKGGDFLYRWGNPQAYKRGTANDQQLFGQHFPYFIPDGLTDAGKIILYNNGFGRTPRFSEVFLLDLPTESEGVYSYTSGTSYGPSVPEYIYSDPVDPTNFYSAILSSALRLPNGNTLICDGDSGYFFEIDVNENIVWEYVNPVGNTQILTQGDDPLGSGNTSFRALKYAVDYPAFIGRDLTPGNPIELNPDLSNCDLLSVNEFSIKSSMRTYPNPVTTNLFIDSEKMIESISVYNLLGKKVIDGLGNIKTIDFTNLADGLYIVKLVTSDDILTTKKVIKN
ncbi:aryl-sulfate sulfotransferase [uncultured Psychroserpens sp.]|uniref:aryl-sulfate sulfotransferase n=1 Tax=uncultured Psychroserpens sp. TaxID=255436 RepID=UPI0026064316|nr:aryl-sulfate sulfotransferase [uncultured Psychroserpens sp.]